MKRREFLQLSGCFAVSASLLGAAGCGDDGAAPGSYSFPHGVASGDPQPSSVMLWTRVSSADDGPVAVTVEVATDEAFREVVATAALTASADSDFTLRVLVEGLQPSTWYFYRFRAGRDRSELGRTWTAPSRDADEPIRLAWVSCQDYAAGFYGAYRHLIRDDEAAPPEERVQLVVHLGDFIYETVSAQFQTAIDESFEPTALIDRNGQMRVVPDVPDGAAVGQVRYARTLADYRHLYKSFLADPDLRAARARWPFVYTWDDHEFSNDCWQSQANYTDADGLDEPAQTRKVAANQAWFEYVPANLTDAQGVDGVAPEAADFLAAEVVDAAFGALERDELIATEANNLAAIGSLTIYRSLRLGKHVELVMTDERSYRSDHAVPESQIVGSPLFFDPRNVQSLEMVNVMDAGATANGGQPPDTVGLGFENLRKTSPPGSMLGAAQKAWWKATMAGSDATWKLWGNEVPLLRFFVRGQGGPLVLDRVMNADAWDGYNHERNELMAFLRDGEIANVVAVTGDIHAHFAGYVMDDHDAADPRAVMIDLCTAGISSNSLFSFFEAPTRAPELSGPRKLITFDATPFGGQETHVVNFNATLLWGAAAGQVAADTYDLQAAEAVKDDSNPHLRYADTNAQGYGLMTVSATELRATLVTIERPLADEPDGPGIRRTASFRVPLVAAGEPPVLEGPTFTGTKPWPLT